MKKTFRIVSMILVFIITLMNVTPVSYTEESKKSTTILFTHDLHDSFYPFDVLKDEEIINIGGYARLYSAIEEERQKDPDLLLVDAGDFSMGTLFQTIFASDSPGLRIMGRMGYDFTTLGNHEFDFRPEGLADSLESAVNSGDRLPEILASNTSFPTDENGELTDSLQKLKDSMGNYGVKEYSILERDGIKIGVFGLMGKEADSNAPMAEVEFTDQIERSKEIVSELKEEGAELIICLSHSGTKSDASKSEDEILAEEVPDIDVIVSGHSHTILDEPIIIGNTIIGSSGSRGSNLGLLNIAQDDDGNWRLDDYRLIPIDASFPIDKEIAQSIEYYNSVVQEKYLDDFDMKFNEVLAYTPFNFTPHSMLGSKHDEDTLGNLISDSFIHTVKEAEGDNYEPIAAAVVPYGTIRASFVKGGITVSDVFNVSSLGIGPDGVSGYPLISAYLTGEELRTAAEVDASIAPIMGVAQLYISGLNYTFNPNRLIFNKVTDIYLQNEDGTREEIKDDEMYRIVAGLYSAQMLSIVGDQSFGLLSIVPKDKEGKPITDFDKHIIYTDDHEIKEWWALAEYLKSFDDEDISQVPEYYSKTQGRKIVDNDTSLSARFKNPNRVALMLYGIILVLIVAIILLVRFITKRSRKKYKQKS